MCLFNMVAAQGLQASCGLINKAQRQFGQVRCQSHLAMVQVHQARARIIGMAHGCIQLADGRVHECAADIPCLFVGHLSISFAR